MKDDEALMFSSSFSDLVVRLGQPEKILPLLVKSLTDHECHLVYQEEVRSLSVCLLICLSFSELVKNGWDR